MATENTSFQDTFDHLKGDGMGGFESLTSDLVSLPFLRIIQSLSPQLKKTKPEYNPKAEEGFWVNSATNSVYGNSLEVVVGKFDHSYIEWKPNRGGFAGRMDSASFKKSMSLGMITQDGNRMVSPSGNDLSETYTYAVIAPEHVNDGVMLFAASSTLLKVARQWNRTLINTFLPNGQRALPYFMRFELKTVHMSNDRGEWYSFAPTLLGFVNAPTLSLVTSSREAMPDDSKIDYSQLSIGEAIDVTHGSDDLPF